MFLRILDAVCKLTVAAIRDPIWFLTHLVVSPIAIVRHIIGSFVVTLLCGIVLSLLYYHGIARWLHLPLRGPFNIAVSVAVLTFLAVTFIRLLFGPIVAMFPNYGPSDSHGSARFSTPQEIAPLTYHSEGVLIGRDLNSGKLLRSTATTHLLTMAPTRSGKGVGTVIPNLLLLNRSVICIDPKGENTRVTGRARYGFGAVHILDPFAISGDPTASYNPFDGLDADSIDIAEDAATLADALVYDEPGTSGDAHWNEEAKALITGLIMLIAACEPPDKRNLARLRDCLTLAPDAFQDLLHIMQACDDCQGLIRRAANRHLAKSDREAAGVLSSAQRHTHFLDSPRMANVLSKSDFSFADLKTKTATVFLVLPPDRMNTYSRWLRLMITRSLMELSRSVAGKPATPVLYLLDEFAALGHLAPIERAMGLMAGYGVQLWPILQDIHQLKATYGKSAGSFMSNVGVLQVFGVNDQDSAKLISDLTGQMTIVWENVSRNPSSEGSGLSYSEQHVGRALLTPDEVRNMHSDLQLLFLTGQRPILAGKLRYYDQPEFRGRCDPP
ncbi:MAG: type IV secretory system conjugative DNA transfer family protein [Asticcacaulis sp.]|uniref:type IV secretory system conjugative DNA transfer family protein n=1 Tax=Asticcacaulis sp. TaxID=1872648 RepID=UPI0039E62DCE